MSTPSGAFLDGQAGPGWHLFDPTRMADAADVAFCTPFGSVQFDPPHVWIEALDETGPPTTMAVRAGDA